MNNVEVMDRGMACLLKGLGSIDTERFISLISREKFDYTEWQRSHFDSVSSDDFYRAAVEYAEKNPFERK